MTAASPAAAINPKATGSAATAARPQISARLPVSDWQIRWWLQPDGRAVLEVTDQAGNLTGLVASTRLPIVSVDGAWRGTRRGADGTRQRWALAIGHDPRPARAWACSARRNLMTARRYGHTSSRRRARHLQRGPQTRAVGHRNDHLI